MSDVSVSAPEPASDDRMPSNPPKPTGLPRPATLYLVAVAAAATAAAVPALLGLGADKGHWVTFLVLAASAAGSWLFVVPLGRNHAFPIGTVFIIAGALLLPVELVALLGVAQHVPDVIRRSYPWYIQTFNVSNYTLNALAAWAVVQGVTHLEIASGDLQFAAAGAAACVVFVLLNHLLLATALLLARGHSFRDSGLFSVQSLWIDFGLAALGIALAALWNVNPYLAPAVVAPLLLIHRSFSLLAALRQSEERFRTIFESNAMGIRLVDLDGKLLTTNRSFDDLLGYEAEELEGKPVADLTHPDDVDDDRELFAAMVAGARDSYQIEKRYVRKDGEAIWGQLTSSLVRDADGKPQFSIGMVQDVTRRKQLEEQLRQSQKMEAVGRLAGGIAHDFNNLLTVIETYSAFVLGRLASQDELRKDVEEIQKAGQRAAALTRQLLAFSRRQVLQPQVLDLNAIVSETDEMLRRLIGEDVDVVTALEDPLGSVRADPGEISQVLVNLAVNARDALPRGGRMTIETANVDLARARVDGGVEAPPGRYVALAVADTGVGMDTETKARIFEPFFTTKETGKGTGLGLATVYGIVAQSGGYIFVTSAPEAGARFEIYLPRVAEPFTVAANGSQPDGATAGSETVLVVEDEDTVRGAVRRILGSRGYRVLEAFDGSDALRVTERHDGRIDLLVTDVVMPRLSGPELVEQLTARRPGMQVLYMSGYPDESNLSESVAVDGVEFIQKPFTEDGLAEKVRTMLDLRQAATAAGARGG